MKISVEKSSEYKETEIVIRCSQVNEDLDRLIAQIQLHNFSVVGKKDGNSFILKSNDILYFESVDNKTFVYCENDVYEAQLKLFEFEERFKNTDFIRISKSSILNISKLKSVKSYLNGRLECSLINGEKILASRHYVQKLKFKLGL